MMKPAIAALCKQFIEAVENLLPVGDTILIVIDSGPVTGGGYAGLGCKACLRESAIRFAVAMQGEVHNTESEAVHKEVLN